MNQNLMMNGIKDIYYFKYIIIHTRHINQKRKQHNLPEIKCNLDQIKELNIKKAILVSQINKQMKEYYLI
jgi:hypothetical protein